MPATRLLFLAALTVLLGAAALPPVRKGTTEGRLEVEVAPPEGDSGLARATLKFTIRKDDNVCLAEPQVIDPAGAWKSQVEYLGGEKQGQTVVRFNIRLEQDKPGVQPLPSVKVGFHTLGHEDWDELEWTDLLKSPRELAFRDELPPPDAAPRRRPWWVAGAAGGLLLAGVLLWRAARRRRPALTPAERALQDLARLEREEAGPRGDAWFATQLSDVLRRYLGERFGLPAERQTTDEFVRALGRTPELSPEQREALRDLFERWDLGKFAGAALGIEGRRRMAAAARAFVEQTARPERPAAQARDGAGRTNEVTS